MTQQRLINFGTTADAAKVKEINQQFFGPQVLRAAAPFMSAVPPDQLQVQPHGVVFENGTVLVEDEIKTFTVTTGPGSADFTLFYEHIDEDIIGGSPATLELRSGLFETLADSVILGWVRYPGGSVPIDGTMLFPNDLGQVQGGVTIESATGRHDLTAATTARSADITESTTAPQLGITIPATPHQVTIDPLPSKLLAYDAAAVRVFSHADGVEYTRVVAGPTTLEFSLEPTTGLMTFNAVDEGKVVDVVDLTYGQGTVLSVNTVGSTRYADIAYSFELRPAPFRRVFVEYVVLDDYTVDLVEVLDADRLAATVTVDKVEPTTPDGTISRLSIRLLGGRFNSTAGDVMTIRLRKTLGPDGKGLELRTRATTYDLPF